MLNHMTAKVRRAALALALATGLAGFGLGTLTGSTPAAADTEPTLATAPVTVNIPQCAEDEPWLLGRGDFDGTRWDRYKCVHVDRVEMSR